jgi:hypothetical protein
MSIFAEILLLTALVWGDGYEFFSTGRKKEQGKGWIIQEVRSQNPEARMKT